MGKRFSGTYRVRKVTHKIDGGGFSTDFSITAQSHSSLLGMLRKQLVDEPSPTGGERFFGVVRARCRQPRARRHAVGGCRWAG